MYPGADSGGAALQLAVQLLAEVQRLKRLAESLGIPLVADPRLRDSGRSPTTSFAASSPPPPRRSDR